MPIDTANPTYNELLQLLDDVSAAAENLLLGGPSPGDRRARGELFGKARAMCDSLLRSDDCDEED